MIKLVLPLTLPAAVQRHEQITPQMVDGLGVITDPANKAAQDKFAFVFPGVRKTFAKFREAVVALLKDLPHNDPQPPMPKDSEGEKPKKRGRKAKGGDE